MNMLFPPSLPSSRRAVAERQFWGKVFGGLVRIIRMKDSRSLEEIAQAAGMEASQWEAMEAGKVPRTWEEACGMAEALGMNRSGMASLVILCAGAWGR
jgi:hypothetical protein